jgi:hypothetical protein
MKILFDVLSRIYHILLGSVHGDGEVSLHNKDEPVFLELEGGW